MRFDLLFANTINRNPMKPMTGKDFIHSLKHLYERRFDVHGQGGQAVTSPYWQQRFYALK